MSAKYLLRSFALGGALLMSAGSAVAADWDGSTAARTATSNLFGFSATPDKGASADATSSSSSSPPLYADTAAAPAPEPPNIHGFFSSPFKTAYVTPRGLVVENAGLVWQPVVGLVIPIGDFGFFKDVALIGGIWNSVNTAQQDPFVGAWNEMDVFVSVSTKVTKDLSLALTYSPWNSPPHAFHTEHNADLKISYDDSHFFGKSGFGFHPYVDLFWAISGDSTVILGDHGDTGYAELGFVPTYTLAAAADYPVTLTFPIYTQVGPRTYWAQDGLPGGNVGLISAAANASVPLAFIPTKYGFWHADIGVTYDYLVNESLLHAGTIASGNTDRNVVIGSIGFGFNF